VSRDGVAQQSAWVRGCFVAHIGAIEELKTSIENSNTRKGTSLWIGVTKKWAALRNICEDM
jgi:hypothetical protein